MTTGRTTNYGLALPGEGPVGSADDYHDIMQAADTAIKAGIDAAVATAIPLTQKGAASGVASLNSSSKVVQNPANATATPTASKIPIADGSGKLDAWVTGGTGSQFMTYTATTTAVGQVLYMKADGTAALAKADVVGTMYAIGFGTEIKTAQPCIIQFSGPITIIGATFTKGLPVYVSPTTAGAVTQTPPVAPGDQAQVVGIALSATDIEIQIGPVVEVGTGIAPTIAGTITTASTIYPSSDGTNTGTKVNHFTVTSLGGMAQFDAPVGTWADGEKLVIRIADNGTSRALDFTTSTAYVPIGVTLPTASIGTSAKYLYLGCIYNSTSSKWDVVAVMTEV